MFWIVDLYIQAAYREKNIKRSKGTWYILDIYTASGVGHHLLLLVLSAVKKSFASISKVLIYANERRTRRKPLVEYLIRYRIHPSYL